MAGRIPRSLPRALRRRERKHDLLARSLRVERIVGAGIPFPYRYKLGFLWRVVEPALRFVPQGRRFGNMLVARCSVPV